MSGIVPGVLLLLILTLAVLAVATSLGVARLEAEHPPTGQFVEVQGVQLHVAEVSPMTLPGPSPPSC
jgi:hypothetical protein